MNLNLKQRVKLFLLRISPLLYEYSLVENDPKRHFWPDDEVYRRNRLTGENKYFATLSYLKLRHPKFVELLGCN